MGDTPVQPTGRARGRARGRDRTSEEALAALRTPGTVPPQGTGVAPPAATGRGRGASGEREAVARGRGVSQQNKSEVSKYLQAGTIFKAYQQFEQLVNGENLG